MAEKENLDFEIVIIDDNSPDGIFDGLICFIYKASYRN